MRKIMKILGRAFGPTPAQPDATPAPQPAPFQKPERKKVQRFVVVDEKGVPTSFYSNDMHAEHHIPKHARPVTEEQYRQFMSHGGVMRHRFEGASIVEHALDLTIEQRAAQAIGAGYTVNGVVFATDPISIQKVGAVAAVVAATGKFPNDADFYPMRDTSGKWQSLGLVSYSAVAAALAAYAAELHMIADGNPLGATELPARELTVQP